MVIGGMSEIAATKGARVARARGTIADEHSEADGDQRRDQDAAAEAGQALGRIRPQQQVATALVRHASPSARTCRAIVVE